MRFVRFLAVGVMNTLIGYAIFLISWRIGGLPPELANAIGYGVAVGASFFLNKKYVFRAERFSSTLARRFAVSFSLSFGLNQLVLSSMHRLLGVSPGIAQIVAMTAYTVIFYKLNSNFVFRANEPGRPNK